MNSPSIRSLADLASERRKFSRPLVLFSGGLDGAYLLSRMKEFGIGDVTALTVDLGSNIDFANASATCQKLHIRHEIVDGTEEFVRDFVAPSIAAQARYLGMFPVHATLSRPALALSAMRKARHLGCDAVLHTATASQNSLRRFNGALGHLAEHPQFGIRGLQFGSPFEYDDLQREAKRFTVLSSGLSHYVDRTVSIDSSIYGVAFEAAALDDPEHFDFHAYPELFEPPAAMGGRKKISVRYSRGLPVAIDGADKPLVTILRNLKELGREFGLGWHCGLEENGLGEKVHEVRVMPAADILSKGYRYLEAATVPYADICAKLRFETEWITEAVEGRWYGAKKVAAQEAILNTAKAVSGEVDIDIVPYTVRPIAVRAAAPLYIKHRRD